MGAASLTRSECRRTPNRLELMRSRAVEITVVRGTDGGGSNRDARVGNRIAQREGDIHLDDGTRLGRDSKEGSVGAESC